MAAGKRLPLGHKGTGNASRVYENAGQVPAQLGKRGTYIQNRLAYKPPEAQLGKRGTYIQNRLAYSQHPRAYNRPATGADGRIKFSSDAFSRVQQNPNA